MALERKPETQSTQELPAATTSLADGRVKVANGAAAVVTKHRTHWEEYEDAILVQWLRENPGEDVNNAKFMLSSLLSRTPAAIHHKMVKVQRQMGLRPKAVPRHYRNSRQFPHDIALSALGAALASKAPPPPPVAQEELQDAAHAPMPITQKLRSVVATLRGLVADGAELAEVIETVANDLAPLERWVSATLLLRNRLRSVTVDPGGVVQRYEFEKR